MKTTTLEHYFHKPEFTTPRRLIASIEGPNYTGKTTLALTAPEPIGLINFDFGDEGVIGQFKGKDIVVADMPAGTALFQDGAGIEVYEAAWERAVGAFYAAADKVKTLIIDTAGELYKVDLLAHLGRLTNIPPFKYGIPNGAFRKLIRDAYERKDLNLILIHHLKEEWRNDKPTGNMIPDGFGKTPDLVQVRIETFRDDSKSPPEFGLRVLKCRQNTGIMGLTLTGGMCNLDVLISMVHG